MATKVIDANAIVSHAKPLMNQRSCEIRESGHSVDPLARCLALLDELREKMEQEFAALRTHEARLVLEGNSGSVRIGGVECQRHYRRQRGTSRTQEICLGRRQVVHECQAERRALNRIFCRDVFREVCARRYHVRAVLADFQGVRQRVR